MKGITNKVLMALSLLSVAGSVFGVDPYAWLRSARPWLDSYWDRPGLRLIAKIRNDLQNVTVDEVLMDVSPYWQSDRDLYKPAATVALDFLKSSMAIKEANACELFRGSMGRSFLARAIFGCQVRHPSMEKDLQDEMTAKAVFGFLKPLVEQGVKIQQNAGIDAGSTLRERVAMKYGLVNKISEVARTAANTTVGKFVCAHPVAVGALAVTGAGAGLYKLYNTQSVQGWLKKKGLIKK